MIIKVIQEYIDFGLPSECRYCPVALAVKSQLGHTRVQVSDYKVTIEDCEGMNDIELPKIAVDFIHNFDMELPVQPFEFELDYEPR